MQTIAELCDELGILGASFFFLRGADRRNVADHLIPTLAYQLAKRIPSFEKQLAETILNDPAVFSGNLASQIKSLILNPMAIIAAQNPLPRQQLRVILVDGLDECQLEMSQREIVSLLSSSASACLRFIISSRPELAIRDTFSIPATQMQTQTLALDQHYLPDRDVQKFLEDKFWTIKASHLLRRSLPQNWPGGQAMDTLVRNSSGQFIYAATVIRYIESPRQSPIKNLATVLKARLSPGVLETPFALLDSLYHQILEGVSDITSVLHILKVHLYSGDTVSGNLHWIEILLNYSPGEAELILCDMHSLLGLENTDKPNSAKLILHHKSLADFLCDPLRARNHYLHPEESRKFVFINILNQFDGEN